MSESIENTGSNGWLISMTPTRITEYYRPEPSYTIDDEGEKIYSKHSRTPATWKKNFKSNQKGQNLSQSTTKKVRNAVDWMYYGAKEKRAYNFKSKSYFTYRVSFFTATLSSPQIHDDNVIKRDILRPFLDWLRKDYNVDKYIWRLEKQNNFNTHFHIVLDKFIHWAVLRRKWNYFQEKLGYISRYSKIQIDWHKNGFKPRPELFRSWSLDAQRRAYIEGFENGFSNPNSTDIHSFKGIRNVALYVTKYITKNEKKNPIDENATNQDAVELSEITGRIWGISELLSGLRLSGVALSGEALLEIQRFWRDQKITKREGDFFVVFYIDVIRLQKFKFEYFANLIIDYMEKAMY